MNLRKVSSPLYNVSGTQQKAERGKGQIRELNNLSLHSKRLTEVTLLSNLLLEKSLSLRRKQDANLIEFSSIP